MEGFIGFDSFDNLIKVFIHILNATETRSDEDSTTIPAPSLNEYQWVNTVVDLLPCSRTGVCKETVQLKERAQAQ